MTAPALHTVNEKPRILDTEFTSPVRGIATFDKRESLCGN